VPIWLSDVGELEVRKVGEGGRGFGSCLVGFDGAGAGKVGIGEGMVVENEKSAKTEHDGEPQNRREDK
jgi:hypothetical protein